MNLQQALDILARVGAGETLSVAELKQARDVIARQLHALKGESIPDLDALTTLRESYFAADAAVKAAEEAEKAVIEKVDAALADIPDPDEKAVESEDDPEDEDEPEDDPEDEEKGEGETEASTKKPKILSVREAVSRLGLDAPGSGASEPPPPDLAKTETRVTLNGTLVKDATLQTVAQAFRDSASASLKAGKERVARIETTFAEERTLSGKIGADTDLIDSFMSPEAVTAAGGCCSLPQPIYSNPVQGDTSRPIKSSLNTLGATRGKFTFFPAICVPVDGVGLWSCEDDELVSESDPSTWKECAEVDCDESDMAEVEAIYTCVTVGNYTSRFAPEQWQGYLSALAIQQARVADIKLFAAMRAAVTTTHTGNSYGSTYANLVNNVALAAAAMRQDQRLGDIQLNLWIAEWIKTAIRNEMRARRVYSSSVDDPNFTDTMLASAFANEGIKVTYSQDLDLIEGASGQVDGPLTALPSTAGAVLAPDGYFTFLDGGTLDLGIEIRDHNLNRQNRVAAFAEGYEGLLARGCNAKALDIPVEICDTVPCPGDEA